ncbi:sulfite exporter TauE/SafE family protein [Ningiella sp. W23]|uniref:sulfite exporter TauE/SafE family protein n=1 Tax=Ningiella sp. W23 TaxID=3023715 RepID=UPI00375848A9
MDIDIVLFVITLCCAGAVAGLMAGLFGIGGGFVVVPALLAVLPFYTSDTDQLMKVAIGTSLASIVISSARSVQAHNKKGAVDFNVLKSWALWLIIGVTIGLFIASIVNSTTLILIFSVGVLGFALFFLCPKLFSFSSPDWSMPSGPLKVSLASFLGGFSALLGIGGGTITVITMVTCNRSVHQAVATAAGVGFIIGVPGAIGFLLMGHNSVGLPFGTFGYVNLPGLLAISIGSLVTAPLGAKLAHLIEERLLKRLFGIYLLSVSLMMYLKTI